MRCICTEVTLGLNKAARSGEKDLWHVQSAIDAMTVSDTVQYSTAQYKVCECGVMIRSPNNLILSSHPKPKRETDKNCGVGLLRIHYHLHDDIDKIRTCFLSGNSLSRGRKGGFGGKSSKRVPRDGKPGTLWPIMAGRDNNTTPSPTTAGESLNPNSWARLGAAN
jgi:hypothetical protein